MNEKLSDKEKVNFIFATLAKVGVSIVLFKELTTISRVTLHKWKKGGNINDKLRLELAYKKAQKLAPMVGMPVDKIKKAMGGTWSR